MILSVISRHSNFFSIKILVSIFIYKHGKPENVRLSVTITYFIDIKVQIVNRAFV